MASSWQSWNGVLERVKRFRVLRVLYRLPWAPQVYHFLLAFAGAVLYRFPGKRISVIGVTGTKGKTTVVEILDSIFRASGAKTAVLSSIRVKIGDAEEKNLTSNTQPGRFFTQYFLRKAEDEGCTHAFVEVTSEGVPLSRHRFVKWAGAVAINLAPEHIESHGSFEKYRVAKLAFLRYAARKGGMVFVNTDNEGARFFAEHVPARSLTTYSVSDLPSVPEGAWKNLPGKFSRENVAGAVAVARHFGISDEDILQGLLGFKGVKGRMQWVQREPFGAVVDYAHTPDSLEAVYSTLREDMPKTSRLICVLGSCGGGRDKWKRPVMGAVAARYCDEMVFTNEDPYDEPAEEIMEAMAEGARKEDASRRQYIIEDRNEALRKAVSLAGSGDVVVSTGKGSEHAIHVAGGREIPWDEAETMREVLGIAPERKA